MADDNNDKNKPPEQPVDESMEEEDEMEMEIDETVPNTPIIENKRNSDDFLALMKETTTPTLAQAAQNVLTSTKSVTSSQEPDTATEKSASSQETPSNNQLNKPSGEGDDDIEIIDVSTPKRIVSSKPKRGAIQDDDDVVCLDDDDPKPKKRTSRSNQLLPQSLNDCEIIDLVDSKKGSANSKCVNYACKSGVDMSIAPSFCLTFYRVKSSINKKQEVCRACCDIALQHFDGLAQSLIKGEMLMKLDIPIRSDLVEIDDSDSEDELDEDISEGFDEDNLQFLRETIDKCMEETMKKYKIEDHGKNAMSFLKEKGAAVKDKFVQVDTMLHNVRKRLDGIHHDLYAEFKVRYEHLPAINISDVIYPATVPIVRNSLTTSGSQVNNNNDNGRHSSRKVRSISYVELDDPNSSNSNSPALAADAADSDFNSTGIEAIDIPPIPADLPPKGPIQKPPLKIDGMYYAVRFLTMGSWIRVRLTQIINPGSIVNGQAIASTMYCVAMESKQTKYPTNRLVSGKEIAYSFSSPVLLDVGTRVIAIFRETPSTGETKKLKKEAFYPGIIAEPCSYANRFRYLIFFDDGYAQYVEHKFVHLIYESSKDVWEDMHIDSRPFIKKYLESYPERPMVKLRKDQTVRTEYNGKWWLTTVMNIDCSLVQMFFEASSRIEWIYRGSTRLNPMFKEELAASNRNNKSRIPRQFNETGPYVQYTREPVRGQQQQQLRQLQQSQEQEETRQTGSVRSVARKSTSRPIIPPTKIQTVPFLPVGNYTPPPSKVVYFTPRAQANTKTVYEDHVCSLKCKTYISYDVNKLKGYNPLSKPLLCGWNRVTYKHKGKREINYKAPCGRFIRNMAELHKYLRITQSEMTVDLFDFDFWVHCLAEFVLERNSTINKDMSLGLENVAIPVVNYVDNDRNDFCNYSIKREPMEGVHMNLDQEFLCGCDCEDDCEDKSKCQCWQLTLQGLPYLNKNMSPEYIGYTYRRLPEPVITGIYECNSRCKCAKTCLNRVVQNPLQLKLQVFKTNNRGWGIRCLNDIPQGAFICIYAGSILTEQMANEGGKNYGDEYLAELDYIEVVEKMKEDYEDEVVEDDDGKEGTKSREESADEEEEEKPDNSRGNRKRGAMEDDTDFMPSSHVPKGKDSSYKTRLRRRAAGENDKNDDKTKPETNDKEKDKNKDDEDECVTISDDEDAFREPSSFNPKNESNLDDSRPSMYKSVREMFAEDECIYVMDAKVTGNIGRFLNHSCSPNVFVQNVFVDTHDLRFPWVAFFALTYIRAGTELTWNYNYDVGSVPGKILYCHCSSQECRGRLL